MLPSVRIKLLLSYDGTTFHGWQRQKNTRATVQEALETVLSRVANSRVRVMGSGRTDAGVHARIQCAHADVPRALVMRLGGGGAEGSRVARLEHALNSLLPREIRVWRAGIAPPDFHAQLQASGKTYLYFVDPNPVQWPHLRRYAWHLKLPLDWDAMNRAAGDLVGRHDFRAFCASDSSAKTFTRTVEEAWWGEARFDGFAPARLKVFRIRGDGFLKQMVRGIVGTLVKIGSGRADPSLIRRLLESGVRQQTGATAPPHGLWLWDIRYLTSKGKLE